MSFRHLEFEVVANIHTERSGGPPEGRKEFVEFF